MTQLQKFVLVVTVVLIVAFVGRAVWSALLPSLAHAVSGAASLAGAVPGWAWWIVFGIAMTFLCPLKVALFGRRCRSSSRCA